MLYQSINREQWETRREKLKPTKSKYHLILNNKPRRQIAELLSTVFYRQKHSRGVCLATRAMFPKPEVWIQRLVLKSHF